jgi:hypothetical protein
VSFKEALNSAVRAGLSRERRTAAQPFKPYTQPNGHRVGPREPRDVAIPGEQDAGLIRQRGRTRGEYREWHLAQWPMGHDEQC